MIFAFTARIYFLAFLAEFYAIYTLRGIHIYKKKKDIYSANQMLPYLSLKSTKIVSAGALPQTPLQWRRQPQKSGGSEPCFFAGEQWTLQYTYMGIHLYVKKLLNGFALIPRGVWTEVGVWTHPFPRGDATASLGELTALPGLDPNLGYAPSRGAYRSACQMLTCQRSTCQMGRHAKCCQVACRQRSCRQRSCRQRHVDKGRHAKWYSSIAAYAPGASTQGGWKQLLPTWVRGDKIPPPPKLLEFILD